MWTKNQITDHIIDQIIKMIMLSRHEPYFYNEAFQLDLAYYRRTVSDSGYIQTGGLAEGDNRQNIIYQEDYQKYHYDSVNYINNSFSLELFIDQVSQCYFSGQVNQFGDKLYNIPDVEWVTPSMDGAWIWDWNGFTTEASVDVDEFNNPIYGTPNPNFMDSAHIVATHSCPADGGGTVDLAFTLEVLSPSSAACNGCVTPVLNLLSQMISLENDKTLIDSPKANEILDTTIYELLPGIQTRQERVDRLFSEFNQLLSPIVPSFDTDGIDGVDNGWDMGGDTGPFSDDYSDLYDISKLGPNAGYITRLVRHTDEANINKSLESLRNQINPYLRDIDEIIDPVEDDQRIDYEDVAEGYLKFRGLNQSIIIRSENNELTGLEDYQNDGFTITMWVRFIDKKSNGTLFNFGAPLGNGSTYGFMLETFSLGEDDFTDSTETQTFSEYNGGLFTDNSHARFIRLVVNDNGSLYSSHVGSSTKPRQGVSTGLPHVYNQMIGEADTNNLDMVFNYTQVPVDRNEWYFIVANYSPLINETEADELGTCSGTAPNCTGTACNTECVSIYEDSDYWRWNVTRGNNAPGTYINNSGEGARCKVEIISKSDLLRARGYNI